MLKSLMMKNLIFLAVLLLFSCRANVSMNTSKAEFSDSMEALVTEIIDGNHGSVPGISMTVLSRGKEVSWSGAQGYDSKEEESEVGVDQPFRIASVTKTFVATAILRLHEMDSLSIDDSVAQFISDEHKAILEADGYNLNKITLKHCLHHTSGLYDYAVGEGTNYTDIVLQNPNKRWTRTQQIQGAVDWGDKLGEPGDKYAYSDTGYILLGETIEYFFNGDLAKGIRTLVDFDKLKMNHTWLESLEDAPAGVKDLVHCYYGRENVTGFDPSLDLYGGGGLVSTTGDLVKFIDALFHGQIFEKETTLPLMLSKAKFNKEGAATEQSRDYRCGLFSFSLFSNEVFAHSGLWDVYVLYDPSTKTAIATNYTNRFRYRLVKKVVKTVNNL